MNKGFHPFKAGGKEGRYLVGQEDGKNSAVEKPITVVGYDNIQRMGCRKLFQPPVFLADRYQQKRDLKSQD